MKCVINAVLLFLHFNFSSSTNLDNCDTARKTCYTFCNLATFVVRFSFKTEILEACDMRLNCFTIASTFDNSGRILGNLDGLCRTKIRRIDFFELNTDFITNQGTASKNCNILEVVNTRITITRSLNSSNLDSSAHLIDNEGCKSFTINIFSDNEKRLIVLGTEFESRYEFLHCRNLVTIHKDDRIFKNA